MPVSEGVMSEFVRPVQSDFVRELQRLIDTQRAAIRAKDVEAIDLAAHDVALFLRLHRLGRLQEWFDHKAAQAGE